MASDFCSWPTVLPDQPRSPVLSRRCRPLISYGLQIREKCFLTVYPLKFGQGVAKQTVHHNQLLDKIWLPRHQLWKVSSSLRSIRIDTFWPLPYLLFLFQNLATIFFLAKIGQSDTFSSFSSFSSFWLIVHMEISCDEQEFSLRPPNRPALLNQQGDVVEVR